MQLKTIYKEKSAPALKQQFNLKNSMAVPKIQKVVVNVGVGKTLKDAKMLDAIIEDIRRITGQAPVKTIAKKSIAGFKIREGQVVGVMVTLRGNRMYDFLEKLVRVALPRVRDFRGLDPKKFDRHGNYNVGIKEQIVFPETIREHVDYSFGLEVNIQTSTDDDKQALELLKSLGFPFQKE
ncbi:MAG: 50S ribosomal protein L5 [Candidatus Doudnabacteria bacterium RIFCSPLOWO2_02_FULL_42_9]|uniref:Large ribosomal subunit protein uL5 n=1 Tax=Candidatus Doudnabacteria bacterium RIFCSPHIGHO2_01_FULL_41_86 TaxID=1817821 RepID=A0A1F5N9F3_9BACT|nr:ribosomal protein L5 [uncultured bacterium]OGE74234.1 MAG: 50S ribosomal protein L5 [Candidatus Doudnabacteria bacterium RIFCSPHIGHO2_01_FULL_41_86]OGE75020.1 MAG: 50S ribosomal protein L5 [Candidatus Doudnabacteria bacterium RIFCSPHIGHO2_01_43_10]OGE85273.1 MAG: 50S ribosomal protein L5 [Candidatus Doudnabacteria bacterium RIFCSPHIGHO2_12_FULL_42_22]OGE86811.1 MAG: 50S ribosomal protein L5 [Candidatus Doudnabacteria bacterium RIFCSPHIGHO2_02_FULL_42_25]OGE92410.1 MAG: 50S ribosomal protein